MNIRPVSDLRNKYNEVERELIQSGAVYLTRNGYGTAVLVSIDEYNRLSGINDQMPAGNMKNRTGSFRGVLREFADTGKWDEEKNAGRMHAVKKYVGTEIAND